MHHSMVFGWPAHYPSLVINLGQFSCSRSNFLSKNHCICKIIWKSEIMEGKKNPCANRLLMKQNIRHHAYFLTFQLTCSIISISYFLKVKGRHIIQKGYLGSNIIRFWVYFNRRRPAYMQSNNDGKYLGKLIFSSFWFFSAINQSIWIKEIYVN